MSAVANLGFEGRALQQTKTYFWGHFRRELPTRSTGVMHLSIDRNREFPAVICLLLNKKPRYFAMHEKVIRHVFNSFFQSETLTKAEIIFFTEMKAQYRMRQFHIECDEMNRDRVSHLVQILPGFVRIYQVPNTKVGCV